MVEANVVIASAGDFGKIASSERGLSLRSRFVLERNASPCPGGDVMGDGTTMHDAKPTPRG